MMVRTALSAVLVCCLGSLPALAGAERRIGEVGIAVGETNYGYSVESDTGGRRDLRASVFVGRSFQAEGQVISSRSLGPLAGSAGARIQAYMVNGVANFMTDKSIVPYVLMGVGRVQVSRDEAGGEVRDGSGALQLALGGRYWIGRPRRLAIRSEISVLQESSFGGGSTHRSYLTGLSLGL